MRFNFVRAATVTQFLLKQQYPNPAAVGLLKIALQIDGGGPGHEEVATKLLQGIGAGLGEESKHKYPICPFCGQRHPRTAQDQDW